jgi:hypothetical protein
MDLWTYIMQTRTKDQEEEKRMGGMGEEKGKGS